MVKTIKKKWVLVADGGQAKILTHFENSFQVVYEIQSTSQHTPSKDMATDKDGNFHSSKHHSKGNSVELHEQAETAFITELTDRLEKEFYSGKFVELTLIMSPKALGKIRQLLSKNLKAAIKQEIDKDLTNFPERELRERLEKLLP